MRPQRPAALVANHDDWPRKVADSALVSRQEETLCFTPVTTFETAASFEANLIEPSVARDVRFTKVPSQIRAAVMGRCFGKAGGEPVLFSNLPRANCGAPACTSRPKTAKSSKK